MESFSDSEICLISQKSRQLNLKAGEFLFKDSRDSQWIALLNSGVLGVYLCRPQSDDQLCHFIESKQLLSNISLKQPDFQACYRLQALIDCQLLFVNVNSFREEAVLHRKLNDCHWSIRINNMGQMLLLQDSLRCSSPKKHYHRLLDRKPHLFLQIPLKYIAEYLNISPQSLSRIRNLNN